MYCKQYLLYTTIEAITYNNIVIYLLLFLLYNTYGSGLSYSGVIPAIIKGSVSVIYNNCMSYPQKNWYCPFGGTAPRICCKL